MSNGVFATGYFMIKFRTANIKLTLGGISSENCDSDGQIWT